MIRKICINCKYVTDVYHAGDKWCCLKDEPVKFDEYCDFFKSEDEE